MTGTAKRWAHVTYASFRNIDGRGGWHAGPSTGADQADQQLVGEYAPTSLAPTATFDDFIGAAEIDALPRRFEYVPLPDRGLFLQSVPAGKDATGRPGNVFTHAVVDHDPAGPLAAGYPINLYRSPDLLTPFRAASVNAVQLDTDLAEPAPGPLADLDVAWMMVRDMLGDRRRALYRLQDVLQRGEQLAVLILDNTNEACYWLQALSATLTPGEARRLLRFSTFDRAATMPHMAPAPGSYPVTVVPVRDRAAVARRTDCAVIDPADETTWADSPAGTWAQLTDAVYGAGHSPRMLVDLLADCEPGGAGEQLPRPGDGLARLVQTHPRLVPAGGPELAEQQLSGEHRRGPAVGQDLDVLRRVIDHPQLAAAGGNWPVLRENQLPDAEYRQLVDAALGTLPRLATASPAELIAYLDFLLHTRLLQRSRIRHTAFRDRFSRFPALADWRSTDLPAGAHPQLQTLLELAEQDRISRQRSRADAERTLRQLRQANSTAAIQAWLGQDRAGQKLHRLLAEEVLEHSTQNYALDLLRVYYTVVLRSQAEPVLTGDRARETELTGQLTDLAVRAVRRALEHGSDDREHYVSFGRNIVRRDYDRTFPDAAARSQVRSQLAGHQRRADLPFERDVTEIFLAVARGILAELEDRRKDPQQ